jgi:hypothetical protein
VRKIIKNLLSLLLLVIGVMWALQGSGIVGGSFMTGQPRWLYAGIVVALIGIAGFFWANRSRA